MWKWVGCREIWVQKHWRAYGNHAGERTRAGWSTHALWRAGTQFISYALLWPPTLQWLHPSSFKERGGQRAGGDEKENKPAELNTLLRGNQVSGLTNKGHRNRPGLQIENECDMKINPHHDETGSLCPEKQGLYLQSLRPAVGDSSLRTPQLSKILIDKGSGRTQENGSVQPSPIEP